MMEIRKTLTDDERLALEERIADAKEAQREDDKRLVERLRRQVNGVEDGDTR